MQARHSLVEYLHLLVGATCCSHDERKSMFKKGGKHPPIKVPMKLILCPNTIRNGSIAIASHSLRRPKGDDPSSKNLSMSIET